jgi:prepilin-type N-terminal cleavage/methylation domain-containing protein
MNTKQGFTLIEIVVAIFIMGLLVAVIIPNFRPRPGEERKKFIAELNALVALGWYNALVTHKLHRIYALPGKHEIELQIQTGDGRSLTFELVKKAYLTSRLSMPSQIDIEQIIIEGNAERRELTYFYFVIMPDGLAQDVILNCYDKKDKLPNGEYRPLSLVLNPFSAQFTTYDTFQK